MKVKQIKIKNIICKKEESPNIIKVIDSRLNKINLAETIDVYGDDDVQIEGTCGPIICDDEGPDFSKMIKKHNGDSSVGKIGKITKKDRDPSSMQSLDKISNLDLRRGFEIDKTKKKDSKVNSSIANSDMSNPLAESLTGEQLKFFLEQQQK